MSTQELESVTMLPVGTLLLVHNSHQLYRDTPEYHNLQVQATFWFNNQHLKTLQFNTSKIVTLHRPDGPGQVWAMNGQSKDITADGYFRLLPPLMTGNTALELAPLAPPVTLPNPTRSAVVPPLPLLAISDHGHTLPVRQLDTNSKTASLAHDKAQLTSSPAKPLSSIRVVKNLLSSKVSPPTSPTAPDFLGDPAPALSLLPTTSQPPGHAQCPQSPLPQPTTAPALGVDQLPRGFDTPSPPAAMSSAVHLDLGVNNLMVWSPQAPHLIPILRTQGPSQMLVTTWRRGPSDKVGAFIFATNPTAFTTSGVQGMFGPNQSNVAIENQHMGTGDFEEAAQLPTAIVGSGNEGGGESSSDNEGAETHLAMTPRVRGKKHSCTKELDDESLTKCHNLRK
ncbi:hypothetical protein FRB99_005488 [Tulasnella sp. 403]|nr:hypothetical protein FRB99_005488 [Tulasnella sp. 403]